MTEQGSDIIKKSLETELNFIWAAQKLHGLSGKMRLITTDPKASPWRVQQPNLEFWFKENEIPQAIEYIEKLYNNGNFPNSTPLLDPYVYDEAGANLGTGINWTTTIFFGGKKTYDATVKRLKSIGVLFGSYTHGDEPTSGFKVLTIANSIHKPDSDEKTSINKALFELVNLSEAEQYKNYYTLSGIKYLTGQGGYFHSNFADFFEKGLVDIQNIAKYKADPQKILDAALCWNNYDRHQSLYDRFGIDAANLEKNLKYYYLCARDFELLDATGPARKGADEEFDFVVPGWLPRGAVTLLAATGGTGKSSLAHQLAIKAAIDYKDDEQPTWLGKPINKQKLKGISIYFSGEDGAPIVNARGLIFDPEQRAKRLQFHRTDYGLNAKGEPANFSEFMNRLMKLPDVPLIVIDPARKYLKGDEDDAEVVSDFFEAIEEFAIRKNAATVVVHHLAKGAKPTSVREILDCLRGSQVFIDRPRVVIGMFREGPYTIAGLSKNNIPPNLGMVQGEQVFVRDPKKLDLIQLPGAEGVRLDSVSDEELEEIKQKALKKK